MSRSEEAAQRGERLRAMMDESVDKTKKPATVSAQVEAPEETPNWDHIPKQTILVVEVDGESRAAVAVDTPEGRALISQETSPCPTCKQNWTRSDRLIGPVKILWPEPYKN